MKTKDYIEKLHLSNPNYTFNREKFMALFGEEFKERLEASITACQKMQVAFTYEKFLHIIKEQQGKFLAISNKKAGEPFSEKLFSAFFAIHVIPLREKLFPQIHQELEEKRIRAIKGAEALKKGEEEYEKAQEAVNQSI